MLSAWLHAPDQMIMAVKATRLRIHLLLQGHPEMRRKRHISASTHHSVHELLSLFLVRSLAAVVVDIAGTQQTQNARLEQLLAQELSPTTSLANTKRIHIPDYATSLTIPRRPRHLIIRE